MLGAGLGGQGQGQLFATGLANDDLLLLDGVGGVHKLGNVEALLGNIVLADNLGDLNGLGHANLVGGGVGKGTGLLFGLGDQGNLVGLGLVLLSAVLMLTVAVAGGAISRWAAGGHLHGLGLVGIGDLGGGAGGSHVLSGVLVGADLTLNNGAGLLTDGEDLVEAVVVVYDNLDGEGDGGNLLSESGNADLKIHIYIKFFYNLCNIQ